MPDPDKLPLAAALQWWTGALRLLAGRALIDLVLTMAAALVLSRSASLWQTSLAGAHGMRLLWLLQTEAALLAPAALLLVLVSLMAARAQRNRFEVLRMALQGPTALRTLVICLTSALMMMASYGAPAVMSDHGTAALMAQSNQDMLAVTAAQLAMAVTVVTGMFWLVGILTVDPENAGQDLRRMMRGWLINIVPIYASGAILCLAYLSGAIVTAPYAWLYTAWHGGTLVVVAALALVSYESIFAPIKPEPKQSKAVHYARMNG